jgi:hypothetical protein
MFWRCARLGFFGRRLVGLMLDGSHHGEGEHDERDVTMPAVPGSGFVVIEPELVFGSLEAILDRPAMALDADQGLDRSPGRAPGGEVGEIAVGDITPDQQASCPKDLAVMVRLFAFEIGQFEVAPVVQSWSFGSGTGRQTPPVRSSLRVCDLLGGTEHPLRLAPGCKPMIGIDAEDIAFTGLA